VNGPEDQRLRLLERSIDLGEEGLRRGIRVTISSWRL
jgi:hypothetical protein